MKQPGQWSQWWRMKGPVALLTLALVMSMVEPSEGFWDHIASAASHIGHAVHGALFGKEADQQQQDMDHQDMDQQQDTDQQEMDQQQQQEDAEKVFVDKRAADYIPGPQMKGPIALLTLALVMSMVEPSEGFLHHIFHAVGHFVHGLFGKKADQQQQDMDQQEMDQQEMDQQETDQQQDTDQQQQEDAEKVFVDKRSADYTPGPQ
ncbi:hypothetical protein WMY93_020442 [Mugilogobius chulae]|uniref:Uncharacterized protein n=1 Tax=Mugilogobius chulae TaxID=88201 RepID=A0AAW0NMX9_9GOBI